MLKARDATKKRLDASKSKCRRLERENELLTKQVQELSTDLDCSRAYIDTLLQRNDDQSSEWKRKENQYKQVIGNLRSQIRGGEAVVSLALYKKAVDEARARAQECQDKRVEINTMTRRLNYLERRLIDNTMRATQATWTPPEAHAPIANKRKVTLINAYSDAEDANMITPNSQSSMSAVAKTPNNVGPPPVAKTPTSVRPPPPPLPPPTPPVACRIAAVREAGGRAGLCAKLKEMRRSPLATKN